MAINEMSPYAPLRLTSMVWWRFSEHLANEGFVTREGQIAANVPQMILDYVVDPMVSAAAEQATTDHDLQQALPMLVAKAYEQRHWAPLIAQYLLSGKQIFDLGDTLVEMLANTDVGDCTLKNWHPPYEAFFLRFGKQDQVALEFDEGVKEYADGAFIAVTPWDDARTQRRIKIGFTMVKDDNSGVMMPGYYMDFTPEEQEMPVKEAIQHAIDRRIAVFESEPVESSFAIALKEARIGQMRDCETIIKNLLELVINGMFYIESIGGDTKFSPGRDAPPSYVAEWENASPEKRVKLRKKIISDGYTIVRMAGHELNGTNASGAGGSKKTHWRRGHWRNQPHGEKLSLVKLIWIKPVMINADKGTEPIAGHIYVAPKCDAECKPHKLDDEQSVHYSCAGDGHRKFTWRIAEDGTMLSGSKGNREYRV